MKRIGGLIPINRQEKKKEKGTIGRNSSSIDSSGHYGEDEDEEEEVDEEEEEEEGTEDDAGNEGGETVRYRGIYQSGRRWSAKVYLVQGDCVHVTGSWGTRRETAIAYDQTALDLLGASVVTNALPCGKLNSRRLAPRSRAGFAHSVPQTALPAPLRLLQRLLKEHASANALFRQQQAVLQEGLRIIEAREAAVETFMRELLLLKQPGSRDAALVDVDDKLHMTRLVRWFLELVEDDKFRRMADRAR